MKFNELNQEENEFSNSNNIVSIEQREGIKLTRNASNIYQWEIKMLNLDVKNLMLIDDEIREELDKRGLKYIKDNKEVKRDAKR
jgi:CRISPR/Cas system CSM-associated protein Csm4 (group 5 of RAMP superfamily)